MEYMHELGDLSFFEQELYESMGREFIKFLETTEMQKVYKMPVLYSIYNEGRIRMAVTDAEVLSAWKNFFSTGLNWKDLGSDISIDQYRKITDAQHLSNVKRNPVNFLKAVSYTHLDVYKRQGSGCVRRIADDDGTAFYAASV